MHSWRIRLFSAVLTVLFFSCGEKERVPDGILNKDQMVGVLSELYVTEQKISTLGLKRDSLNQIFGVIKDEIFKKSGVTDSAFRRSLNYYMDRPQTLEVIYTTLIDSLNLREQRLISGGEIK